MKNKYFISLLMTALFFYLSLILTMGLGLAQPSGDAAAGGIQSLKELAKNSTIRVPF